MNYWLFKTDPQTFSLDDFRKCENGITSWEGVRNFQARNFLRDLIRKGDLVLFYHSVVKPPCVTAVARVVRDGYPDHFALDPSSRYHDSRSTPENPVWFMVDIQLVSELPEPVTLDSMKDNPALQEMMLLKKGCRLSVQPVSDEHFKVVLAMGGVRPRVESL
ncbi:MAG: EVE domain-containing protein [Candidatus Wallbacteria bacterium HGW-Wallbacteria-1]|jgi:predicted RNA-binding protein with PUA-like domain|uniref:EVE domain-containing protein n=1 Tax=Candidatus Wallbacteria bacterium HGW-Wallbacteria-1 TaxID=2013854 RepID=A0A2N1PNS3_9BACT|nr:MAG: EVE domain-containing protein [Candidatus Wallbacteria bacterium HGW-Wallbacteria-1]